MALFTIGPILASLYLSFTDYSLLQPPKWQGLANYREMLSDPRLHKSLLVTFEYVFVSVPLQLTLALALALLLNRGVRGLAFYRRRAAAERAWARFWTSGGAVELAGSRDERAPELERRIVLSQYLTAIHCAGSLPPQETGLMVNSWRGRFHLEMHWWHAAHFALWGRPELLDRSLGWYSAVLPAARATGPVAAAARHAPRAGVGAGGGEPDPPLVRDGGYAAIAVPPYTVSGDHPSMLYALGFVPPTDLVDHGVMRATLRRVLSCWPWDTTWGWDYPAIAMTAARLGEPAAAVDALLMPTIKNAYLPNGHNRQSGTLPIYLPGNGGLLSAIALMAAGADGGRPAPGFPADGSWAVRHEGLHRFP